MRVLQTTTTDASDRY